LQNLNSDRSGGSFRVQLPAGVALENIGFHDVDYHSGDGVTCLNCACVGGSRNALACEEQADCPIGTCVGDRQNFDGTDWEVNLDGCSITWATTAFATDPNANALRWSTLYNFRFDANIPPEGTNVTLGLFKPGSPSEVTIQTTGPAFPNAALDCNGNCLFDRCDVSCAELGCDQLLCGQSADCDTNGVPDECEPDCNQNDIADECDIRDGTSEDCNENAVPDECEPDCNGDGIIDDRELVWDCDADGVPDCQDLCPCTTPAGACLPVYDEIAACCYPNGVLVTGLFTWGQCLSFQATPVCDHPPVCPGTPCPENHCRDGCLVGDFDSDGDLDLFDIGMLEVCFATLEVDGPPPSAECLLRFDYDNDGDVDLGDFVRMRPEITGP